MNPTLTTIYLHLNFFYGGCKKMKLNGTFQFFYVMSMTAYENIFFS